MPELGILSRPMRRIIAEWIGKLVDRLLRLQDQLRYGFIRMLSSTVAETIEDQFQRYHRPTDDHDPYEEEYLDESYFDHSAYSEPRSTVHFQEAPSSESHKQPASSVHPEGWLGILSHATNILIRWARGPWVEPVLASAVTLVSLLLLFH